MRPSCCSATSAYASLIARLTASAICGIASRCDSGGAIDAHADVDARGVEVGEDRRRVGEERRQRLLEAVVELDQCRAVVLRHDLAGDRDLARIPRRRRTPSGM